MKSIMSVAAGLLVVAVVTPVHAADLSLPSKEPPPPPTMWTNFHLGGNIGGAWFSNDVSDITTVVGGGTFDTYSGSFTQSGIFGGGQAGFDYEFQSHVVIGGEADLEFAHITGSLSNCSKACYTTSFRTSDFGTARARLGYAWNNVLLFGTGGAAWLNSPTTVAVTTGAFAGSVGTATSAPAGYSFGGGVEWAVFPNWSIKAEYLHLLFRNVSDSYDLSVGGVATLIANNQTNIGVDIARIGVNYLFTVNPAPVVAKY